MSIALIGEAWGEHEERERSPFVGATGHELTRMLGEAGLRRADCLLTNVFNLRPKGNKIDTLCGPKADGIPGYPSLVKGKHVRREFQPELERLADELIEHNPNLVVCLGNTATWAMLGKTSISKLRGTTDVSTHTVAGFKVLPTYHPAAIFRQWELRPVAIMDLIKARKESAYPEIRRPARRIHIPETIGDIYDFDERYLRNCSRLSVDIETSGSQITCLGLAPSSSMALVIPFIDYRRTGRNYWPTKELERQAWSISKAILERRTPKVFQNGLFDIAFLYRAYGIRVKGAEHDTMLLHHALQPESLKGLGFLGSVYTDEGNWKQMRASRTIKRDE